MAPIVTLHVATRGPWDRPLLYIQLQAYFGVARDAPFLAASLSATNAMENLEAKSGAMGVIKQNCKWILGRCIDVEMVYKIERCSTHLSKSNVLEKLLKWPSDSVQSYKRILVLQLIYKTRSILFTYAYICITGKRTVLWNILYVRYFECLTERTAWWQGNWRLLPVVHFVTKVRLKQCHSQKKL